MAKFRQVPHAFLLRKTLQYFWNMTKNYRGDCHDKDFFEIINNCFDHEKAVALVEAAYTQEEIDELGRSVRRSDRLDLSESLDGIFAALWNCRPMRRKCRIVLDAIVECMAAECPPGKGDVLAVRFQELVRSLGLSDVEAEIMIFAYVHSETCFCWPIRVDDHDKPYYYAMAIDRSYGEVQQSMTANGKLLKFGVLDDDWDFNRRALGNYLAGTDSEAIERRFYRKLDTSNALPWEYYGGLAAGDGKIICDIISSSNGTCNILLYGEPGTGKSSFAKTIAKRLGRVAYEVKQGDDNGKNMASESRMIGIQIANGQESAADSLLVVDEADELLRGTLCASGVFGFGKGGKSTEKGVMNSILDEMRLPAIWIANTSADAIDESVRRRFDYSVRFDKMSTAQRVSIWMNLVREYGLMNCISQEQIDRYATCYQTSAGGIAKVLGNVSRLRPTADNVDKLVATLMKPHCALMGIDGGDGFLPAKGYSLAGLNVKGDVSPEAVLKAIRNYYDAGFCATDEDKPRMNVLLFGPPGTGKTELVRFMGKELDRRVLVLKGSDLMSKWVGESERNIASAFRRAETEKAILFFDEIDGLVQDRVNARSSWEVTQVNELLHQMENFNGVMMAATNFCENLDPAIMRRFTFKIEFCPLDDSGKAVFFEKTFWTVLTDAERTELNMIQNLTPGDFRTVRQKQFYLGEGQTNMARIEALREECALKKCAGRIGKIGFGV